MQKRDLVSGVSAEEAEELAAYLAQIRDLRLKPNPLRGWRERRSNAPPPTGPFVRAFPELTLRLWRASFQQVQLPALRSAMLLLIDEVERAYTYLERK